MNTVKNYSILIILTIILLFSGCSFANNTQKTDVNDDENKNNYIANPWVEITKGEAEKDLGIEIYLPDGAENSVVRYNSTISLYDIRFDYDNLFYVYRIKKSAGDEDISGLYCDWTISSDENIKGYKGKSYRAVTEEETVDLVTWVDDKDINYSLTTSAKDLDGFDIIAIAEKLIP